MPRPINHIAFLAGGSRVLLDGLLFDATRHEVLEAMPEPIGGFAVAQDRRVYLSLPRRNAVATLQSPRDNCAPPSDGLLAWWPGDGSAAEARGDLAAQPSPTLGYAPARLGQGFRFDGHATLNLGHDLSLARPWAQGLTIGAWIKPFAVNAGVLFQKDSPNGWNLGLAADDHLRACLSSAQPCLEDPQPLSWAAWHYIALGGDRRGVTLWVDGRAVARTPRTPSASAARADLTAGAGFAGLMDEIVVYEHALSGAEVRALMDLPHCLASVQ